MDPITATGIISIGREIIDNVVSPSNSLNVGKIKSFSKQIEETNNDSNVVTNPTLRVQKLEGELKSELLKDPATATFFQQNKSNQIFLEKRADGSVQFVSSSGQSLIIKKNSPHCSKANEILSLCFENKINLAAMRPNAVSFTS